MQVSRDLRTTLKESASMRHKLREREVKCRLKSCYSSFTSKSKIYRLEKSKESVLMCASTSADGGSRRCTLRSSTEPIDWALCMS